jgi:site-specific DNA recombinase
MRCPTAEARAALHEVEREIAALGATQVESEWVRQCLADFAEIWDVLISENRGRLLRAVVQRVDYDGASGDVRATLADLRDASSEVLPA